MLVYFYFSLTRGNEEVAGIGCIFGLHLHVPLRMQCNQIPVMRKSGAQTPKERLPPNTADATFPTPAGSWLWQSPSSEQLLAFSQHSLAFPP